MINYSFKQAFFLTAIFFTVTNQAFSQRWNNYHTSATQQQVAEMSTVKYWEQDIQKHIKEDRTYEFNLRNYPCVDNREPIIQDLINNKGRDHLNDSQRKSEELCKRRCILIKNRLDAFLQALEKNPSKLKHLVINCNYIVSWTPLLEEEEMLKWQIFEGNSPQLYLMKKLLKIVQSNPHLVALSIPSLQKENVLDFINLLFNNKRLRQICFSWYREGENRMMGKVMSEIVRSLQERPIFGKLDLKVIGDVPQNPVVAVIVKNQ